LINIIIYSALGFSLFYFLIRNRVDFLLLFFLSLTLYHWQIIGGEIILPPYRFEVSSNSKLIVSLVYIIHTFITILHDYLNKNKKERITFDNLNVTRKYDSIFYILTFLSLILSIRAISIVGTDFMFKADYADALQENNIGMVWLHYPAAISILYATLTKNRLLFLLALLPLSFYAYIGFRAVFITAYIGIVIIYSFNSKLIQKKTLIIGFLSTIIFLSAAFYKVTYYDIRNKEIDFTERFNKRAARYEKNEYIKKVLFYNEFGQTSSNLSLSAEQNLGQYYQISTVIFGSIPFVKRIANITEDDVRFSRLIEQYANPGFSYGLGSSIWGEGYAAFNLFGVILFSLAVSIIISYLNSAFYRSNLLLILSPYFLSYLSFYIHRSELALVFAHLKNVIFLLLVSLVILYSLKIFKYFLKSNK
jgi:hypothetical protein